MFRSGEAGDTLPQEIQFALALRAEPLATLDLVETLVHGRSTPLHFVARGAP
jgi:hypothetical protein